MIKMMTKDEFREEIEQFCIEHEQDIINYMMKQLGYDDMELLEQDDDNMKWGADCGCIFAEPKKPEMRKLWGHYPRTIIPVAYYSQSLNIQQPQVDYILETLGWKDAFNTYQHLD